MFERILVPLDGSKESEAVFRPLEPILRRTDAEVILFQAVNLPTLVNPDHTGSMLTSMEYEATDYLERHRARLRSGAMRARTLVLPGRPADTILKTAETQRATLIAISTHGRSGVARWMLGSVTEEVMRHSPIPVLVAHAKPSPAGFGSEGVRTILVPFDGSEDSLAVAPFVIEAARVLGAGVALLKVEETWGHGSGGGFVGHLLEGPVRVEDRADLLDRDLIEAGNPFAEAGLKTTVFRVHGDAAGQINHLARILPAGLIAMATHGRAGVSRLISGSVTEQVVRNSDRPVLVVRSGVAVEHEAAADRRTP
jgi:nucleotide-binding universal stress UspA family protein